MGTPGTPISSGSSSTGPWGGGTGTTTWRRAIRRGGRTTGPGLSTWRRQPARVDRVSRGSPARGVAEDRPAHGGVHVQRLTGARGDPGEAVVDAEGGQAPAHAKGPATRCNAPLPAGAPDAPRPAAPGRPRSH